MLMKLIDKSALVTEMNKLKNISLEYGYTTEQCVIVNVGKDLTLKRLLDYIDTLEVKKVDIEKDVNEHWDEWAKEDGFHSVDFAKHFFELGMAVSNKAQKGEEV